MTDVDEDALVARVTAVARRQLDPGAEAVDLRRLLGGVSSLTYALDVRTPAGPTAELVLKAAPPGLRPVGHRDVLRQARLLRHVAAVDPGFPVPRVVLTDDGDPPLFAMQRLAGVAEEPCLDDPPQPPAAAVVHGRAQRAARLLAALQALPAGDLAAAEDPLGPAAELARWARLMDTVDDDLCPGHEKLRAELEASVPPAATEVLQHGDYRLGNMLFAGERLVSVIDWEIWSLGDPRTDLAWLLMNTHPAHRLRAERSAAAVAAAGGMPPAAELVAEYVAAGGTETADLAWFVACGHYKTAATLGAIVKRHRKAGDEDADRRVMRESLPAVVEQGRAVLDGGLDVLDAS